MGNVNKLEISTTYISEKRASNGEADTRRKGNSNARLNLQPGARRHENVAGDEVVGLLKLIRIRHVKSLGRRTSRVSPSEDGMAGHLAAGKGGRVEVEAGGGHRGRLCQRTTLSLTSWWRLNSNIFDQVGRVVLRVVRGKLATTCLLLIKVVVTSAVDVR